MRYSPEFVVIRFNEDGDPPSVQEMTEREVLDMLAEDSGGSRRYAQPGDPIASEFFSGTVIVRGKIVVPVAERVVDRWGISQ